MKKIYTLIAAAFSICSMNAQILTQSNHAPIVGDVFQTVDCSSVGINPGGNGVAQTWNYSAMSVLTNTVTNTGVTVASTGSASSYPSASVAIQSGTANLFYSANSTNLYYWGGDIKVGGQNVTMAYTSAAIYASYPMAFGTTASSTVAGTNNSIAGPGTFSGSNTVTASGTGTLMLPGGYNFSNVLKVTTSTAMTFTTGFGNGTYSQNKYDYYSSLSKYPLLSITNETISSLAGTTTETVVTVNNNYKTVGVAEIGNETLTNVTVYPNPAKDNISIKFNNENSEFASFQLVNVLGQSIRQQSIPSVKGETVHNLNLNGIESGIYFVKLTVGNKASVTRITVQ
jgi:hypothetical protein